MYVVSCCQILLLYIRSLFTASFPSQSEARPPAIVLPSVFLYRGPRINGKDDLNRRRSRSGDICFFPSLIERACSAAVAELGASENCEYIEQIRSVYSIFLIQPGLEALRFFIPDPPQTIRPLHCPTARVGGPFQQAGCSGSVGACRLSDSSVGRGRFLARISGDMLDRNLRHATACCSGP